MLKDEILEILELFDYYKIKEKHQRKIFENGIYFDYTYGDPDPNNRNKHLDIFGVGMLLKICKTLELEIDIDDLIKSPWDFEHEQLVEIIDNKQKSKTKKLKH